MVYSIAAVAKNGVIGKDNDLIWHLPKDMKFFQETTMGHPIIMGRRNFDSIPPKYCPLSGRQNIIVTRNKDWTTHYDVLIENTLEDAINIAKNIDEDVFIIGGGQIYKLAIEKDLIDCHYITHIDTEFDGDTFFPEFDKSKFTSEVIMEHKATERNPHDFTVIKYLKK